MSAASEPRFPFWTFVDLLLCLALAAPAFLLAFSVSVGAFRYLAPGMATGSRLIVAQFVGYLAAIFPVWFLFRVKYDRTLREVLQWHLDSKKVAPAIASGVFLAIAIVGLSVVLRTPPIKTPMEELLSNPWSLAIAAVLGVTIGPLFEEAFFRGLLQPLTVRTFGVPAGILIPSLLFGLLHGHQYAWSWRHVVLISIAGAAFGYIRQRTASVTASTLMHCSYNSVLFIGLLLGKNLTNG